MNFARAALAVFAAIGVFASTFVSATTIYSNTLSSAGTPNMDNRLFRDGASSACGSPKAFPGPFGGANFAYQQTSYTNSGAARCVTFTVQANCTGGGNLFGTFLAGYSGVFDPNNLDTGYLGDAGSSSGSNDGVNMSLDLAAGQTINLVIMQVNDNETDPPSVCTYFLDDNITRPIPTMSELGLLITALGVGGFGFAYLRRRSARA